MRFRTMRFPMFLSLVSLLLCASHPAQAQSSWWDKNASPAVRAEEAAFTARSRPEQPSVPPLFTGAALILGSNGKLIPANIVGRPATGDGAYIVETRRGQQIVAACDVFDPLSSGCLPSRRR